MVYLECELNVVQALESTPLQYTFIKSTYKDIFLLYHFFLFYWWIVVYTFVIYNLLYILII